MTAVIANRPLRYVGHVCQEAGSLILHHEDHQLQPTDRGGIILVGKA